MTATAMTWDDFARYVFARLGADLPEPAERTPECMWALAEERFATIEAELQANARGADTPAENTEDSE